MAEKGKKYVVLHTAVGPFSTGDVVEAEQLVSAWEDRGGKPQSYDAAPKLLGKGAIREATAAEGARPRVAASEGGAAASPRVRAGLEELDGERERLTRRLADLRDRTAALEGLGMVSGPEPEEAEQDPAVKRLLEEKAAELAALDEAIREADERLRVAEAEAAKRRGAEVKPFAEVKKRHDLHAQEAAPARPAPPAPKK